MIHPLLPQEQQAQLHGLLISHPGAQTCFPFPLACAEGREQLLSMDLTLGSLQDCTGL